MKFFWYGIAVLLCSSLLVCWIVCYGSDSKPAILLAAAAGSMLALLFAGAGFISYYFASTRAESSFPKIFVASIFGRLAFMIIVLLLIFKYINFVRLPFLISLLGCYFIFHLWEVISLNRLAAGE